MPTFTSSIELTCEACGWVGTAPGDLTCPSCGNDEKLYADKVTRWYYTNRKPFICEDDIVDVDDD